MPRIDMNVLIGPGITDQDMASYFGDLSGKIPDTEYFIDYDDPETKFDEVLAAVSVFPSKSQARKAGWHKEIPEGWTDMTIGKLKHRICILKRTKEWVDNEDISGGAQSGL